MKTTHRLINGDCPGAILTLTHFACSFLDPPDAIGLKNQDYDERSSDGYIEWLSKILMATLPRCDTTWLSYNVQWDLAVKHWAHNTLDQSQLEIRPFVWAFTFGQNRRTDCGPGHRPILRFRQPGAARYPDQIRCESERQRAGDKRADPRGKVPLDFWVDPRIVGNAKERRAWHPTQHPESLVERAIQLSTQPGDTVLDLFSGTGTVIRVCKRIGRHTVSVESSAYYCRMIAEEHGLKVEVPGKDQAIEH